MRPELEFFVLEHYAPERVETMKRGFQCLESYSVEEYDNKYIEVMMTYENRERSDNAVVFSQHLIDDLLDILNQHDIQVDSEAKFEDIVEVIEALFNIQDYDDKDSIIRMLETDFNTSEEKLANLFTLVSLKSVDYFVQILESVSPDIFDKLMEIYSNNYQPDDLSCPEDTRKKIAEELKLLKQYIQYDKAVGFKIIAGNGEVGLPFSYYIQYALKEIEYLEFDDIAKELAVLLYMSEDTFQNPISSYSERSQLLFDDINKITRINHVLISLISGFEKWKLIEKQKEQNAQE